MSKVMTHAGWDIVDMLDDRLLQEGESLCIVWPDGVRETVMVSIDEVVRQYSGHGGVDTVVTRRAYTIVGHHGAPARLYLSGLEAERV